MAVRREGMIPMRLENRKTGESRSFTLRPARPEDAAQIIACIREAYGDTYVKPFLYTEEGVRHCAATGEMCFSVAEDEGGRVAGITAYELDADFPGMAEIACHVIIREYNGYGLALPLALHAMEQAEKLPLTGQFARALGCHLISQKTLKGMGFTAAGFLLNVFDKELFRYRYQNGDYAKIPQTLAVRRQGAWRADPLWLPEELFGLARDLFGELGAPLERRSDEKATGHGRWERREDARHATVTLWVRACGDDFVARLAKEMAFPSAQPGRTVNLYLNLAAPGAAAAYGAARERGFFFTGLLPCASDGTYMILHHPLEVPVLLDGIPYIPEYAPFVEQIRRQLCQR